MTTSRRQFLATGLAAAAAASLPLQAERKPARGSSFDPWIEIRPEHLRQNVAEVARRAAGRPILAVIKNNGYGLGLTNVAHVFEPLTQVAGLAVIKLEEALLLRQEGIRKPILLMGPFSEKELGELAAENITPVIYTPIGGALETLSARIQKPVPIHVCVDTGIGRIGVPAREALSLIRDLSGRRGVRIDGIMMTFTEDKEFDDEQFRVFESLLRKLEEEKITVGMKHAVSSFGLFQHPGKFLDMVRPGMALFGVYSEKEFRTMGSLELNPAAAFKAKVIYTKRLLAGESAGYNRVYRAKSDTWVATLPVGHSDGLPRTVVNGASVRIGEDFYRIVAISASHIVVEIGSEQRVRIGDEATLFDWRKGSRPEDVAASCGGSVYDLMMHLNPLLPRLIA